MTFLLLERESAFSAIKSKFLKNEMTISKAYRARIKKMYKELYDSQGVSLAEYLEKSRDYAVAKNSLDQEGVIFQKSKSDELKYGILAKWASGVQPVLRPLYDAYLDSYQQDCTSIGYDVENAKIEQEYASKLKDISESLKASSAITEQEYEARLAAYETWSVVYTMTKQIFSSCTDDIPSYEFLKKIKSFIPEDQ